MFRARWVEIIVDHSSDWWGGVCLVYIKGRGMVA